MLIAEKDNMEKGAVEMTNKQRFNEAKEKHFETLKQYVPVVARVHGKSHPEFHDVHKLFDEISRKINEAGSAGPDLAEEFAKLREVTNSYKTPEDVCESYEAVYSMLSQLDEAYQA
jgi:iron-sulfur cluster repair protein YtfE (RIC family)